MAEARGTPADIDRDIAWASASPYSPDVVADPWGWYRWLHANSPVHHCSDPDLWVLSRYDDVAGALRDPALFSSAEGVTYPRVPLGMMITSDPPDHTRLRHVVGRHFAPAAIAARRAAIAARVEEFLEPLVPGSEVEFVDAVASPLPIAIIADMLGVAAEDRADFKRWSDDVIEGFHVGETLDAEKVTAAARGFAGLGSYLSEAIEERRREPGADIVSLLAQASAEERLTHEETVNFCVLLLIAGNETTTHLLGSLLLSLMECPDQWELLRSRPELVGSAVEESLRHRSPIRGLYRTAVQDVTVRGVEIPKGARVLVLYAAANRDPDRYQHPDRFDIERAPTEHLGFGAGIHFCLGAALARAEAQLTLHALLEKVRGIELAGEPEMRHNPHLYGPIRLPLRLL